MRLHQQAIFLVLCLAVVGDIGSLINSMWTGSELVSHNAGLLIPGADAIWAAVARGAARAIARSFAKKKGGAEHTKGKRPSTKGKHEKGQSRKQRDQDRASGKKQKGGKDGSKKRGGNKG